MESVRELHFQRRNLTDPAVHYPPCKIHSYPKLEVKLDGGSLLWDDRAEPLATLQGSINRAKDLIAEAVSLHERKDILGRIQETDFREDRTGPGCYDHIGEWLVALGSEAFMWSLLALIDDGRDQRQPHWFGAQDWLWLLQHSPAGYIHNPAAVLAYDQWRDGFTPTELVDLGLTDNPQNFLLNHLQDLIKAGVKGPGTGPIPYPGDHPDTWFGVTIPQHGGGFGQI